MRIMFLIHGLGSRIMLIANFVAKAHLKFKDLVLI